MSKRLFPFVVAVIFSAALGCAHHFGKSQPGKDTIFVVSEGEHSLARHWAPGFVISDHQAPHNRIGRPSARITPDGREEVYVDPGNPVIYVMEKDFATEKGNYTNLVYRVHFSEVPFSLVPFHLTTGKNVGIVVVITLDSEKRPVLVTTAGTCGCYAAIVPTTFLPNHAFPDSWNREKTLEVYGETLPPLLELPEAEDPKFLIHVRPDVHRVRHLEVASFQEWRGNTSYETVRTPLEPMDALEELPLNGETTSFYYPHWPLKGHVKGSIKPWESLSLSLISLDLFVGMDKVYGESGDTGNPFYTSLKPWNRDESDMWEFSRFLEFNGWRL